MKTADKSPHKSKRVKPAWYIAALLLNVIVFVFIIWVYTSSNSSYKQKLFNENLQNVESLNVASANTAYTYAGSMGTKISDITSYVELMGLSYEDTVKYLGYSNTDPDRQLQLVLSGSYGATGTLSYGDYSGISIRKTKDIDGTLETVERYIKYGGGYYDILKTFTDIKDESDGGICFAPEFTDPDTKKKCFAVYRHTVLTNSLGTKGLYTVMLAVNSERALEAINVQLKFSGQSTVLVNSDGDYIIKSSEYRNVNFYDYIVNYNGLTLDWRAQLQSQVVDKTADGKCVNLFYKNHRGADCVFSVSEVGNGWYCITCVPLASFSTDDSNVNYSLLILLLFLALFVLDGLAIYLIGRTMSYNVHIAEKATIAANEASQAKSRFLSTMSHELRTPLNAIIGLVSLSGDSIDDPPVLKDYLKKIDISSKLLLQLISDILDVSAIESNKMKLGSSEFDLTKLITSMSAIYYDQCAAKGIEFHVSLKNMHSETLIGDSVRVNQVLLNFLSNAVKFTPSGGKVILSAEQVAKEENRVVIKFSVIDTGCGISEELSHRLFKPFERASGDASRKYSGTGLGLSIAKNIVELMNGQVGFESKEGIGSTFWAEIPFDIPEHSSRKSFSPIENLRVLVAVSDEDEREYIGQILAGFGVERCLTDRANTALELLREKNGTESPFNLCLLDWKLSDLNALDASVRIRREFDNKALPIIILAYDIVEASAKCTSVGADMVFGKPIFPSALYNTLEEISSDKVRTPIIITQNYNLKGKRVLLVEDNKLNTEIAQLLLNKVGIMVETAENGQIGYERFAGSDSGYFDAVLMDIQMPVMDGYESAAAIRGCVHPQARTIPIIAMTADAFLEDVEKARAAGMNEHIAKPVVPENLYALLQKHLS